METRIPDQTFEFLKFKYGSHSEAAKALGISVRHYSRIRQASMATKPLASLMHFLAHGQNQEMPANAREE